MKPRASTPMTLSTCSPANWSARPSMQVARPWASARSGVMSLKVTPGFGNSETSLTRSLIRAAS